MDKSKEKLQFNPLLDIFDVEDYYYNEPEAKERWDSLKFDDYISTLYNQFCQALQQGYMPTIYDEKANVGLAACTFQEWLNLVEENLNKQKELMQSALITGEIPDKNAYNELEYCRRKCLEYLQKYRGMTEAQQNAVIGI